MGKLWSFIVAHFKDAWNATVQWFQRPHRITLIGAIVFLMLALVLSSALVVDNMFIGTVHRDPHLDTLFQWTAYVNQLTVIVFTIAFAVAGLCLLYATVRAFMARKRESTKRAEANAAREDANKSVFQAAVVAADQLAGGMRSGEYSPEVAVPLLAVVDNIVQSHKPALTEAKGVPQLGAGEVDSDGGSSVPEPKLKAPVDDTPPSEDVRIALHAETIEVEENRLSE